jgi:hypothetical protein
MIKKLVLTTLSTILLFSPVTEARPVCGFYIDKMVYNHERIETETKFTTCSYAGTQQMYGRSADNDGAWTFIHGTNFSKLANHVTCPSVVTTHINQYETIFTNGDWVSFWFTGTMQTSLASQDQGSDIEVTYKRIPGSGRIVKVWFPGTNDDDPRRCPGGEGPVD